MSAAGTPLCVFAATGPKFARPFRLTKVFHHLIDGHGGGGGGGGGSSTGSSSGDHDDEDDTKMMMMMMMMIIVASSRADKLKQSKLDSR